MLCNYLTKPLKPLLGRESAGSEEIILSNKVMRCPWEELLYPFLKNADANSENQPWWQGTILLYAAQTNPTKLIQEALRQGALNLAYRCYQETRRTLDPAIEAELKAVVQTARYAELERLLKAQDWLKADAETYRLMITTVGKEAGRWFEREDFATFPCEDLRTIDRLWVSYSQSAGREYGFSVQKKIWEDCGSPTDIDGWLKFLDRIAWREGGRWVVGTENVSEARILLPGLTGRAGVLLYVLFSRAKTCRL
jgi:hypothetical protein